MKAFNTINFTEQDIGAPFTVIKQQNDGEGHFIPRKSHNNIRDLTSGDLVINFR